MLFLESHVQGLLLLHTISATILVAASTHHLVWCRGYFGGKFGRAPGEKRFALIAALAFVCTFVLGNVLYPTYKVRVRAEYLDSPSAVAADRVQRTAEAERLGHGAPPAATGADLSSVARRFDIKEHWVALGCAASLILLLLSRLAHPSQDRRTLVFYLGLSVTVCATAWTGAVIGILTTAVRSVGGGA